MKIISILFSVVFVLVSLNANAGFINKAKNAALAAVAVKSAAKILAKKKSKRAFIEKKRVTKEFTKEGRVSSYTRLSLGKRRRIMIFKR